MSTTTSLVDKELMGGIKYLPCVSLILPFEPKISLKTELEYKLKLAVAKVESELLAGYTEDRATEVVRRLKALVKGLDFSTHKKSIALFVSPFIEKVYYLDIPVEEKIIVDESFEIRDLIFSKKEMHKYLVLVLSSKQSRIYLGNGKQFIRIVSDLPEHVAAYNNNAPEKVANFSDPSQRKEIMLDKFMRHIDDGLGLLLKAYPLPLFVMGTVRTAGHFRKLTRNGSKVIAYIHGNYGEASEPQLHAALNPFIRDWRKVKEKDILKQLDAAMSAHKLSFGMEDVWKEAVHKRGRLLIVEKNFMYPAQQGDQKDIIYKWDKQNKNDFYIKDAVDDVIEKVLANGGDVEFVDEGVLKDFSRIALIGYY